MMLLCLVVPLLAACGGGKSKPHAAAATSTSSTAPGLSRADYVSQANAICDAAYKQIPDAAGSTDPAKYADLASKSAAAFAQMQASLAGLSAPSADRPAINSGLIQFRQQVLDLLNAAVGPLQEAATHKDLTRARSLYAELEAKVSPLQDTNDPFLASYGLADHCEFFPSPRFARVGPTP